MFKKIRVRISSVSEVYGPAELVSACSFFRGKIRFGEGFCESVDLSHISGVDKFGARNLNALLFIICFPNDLLVFDMEAALNIMAPANVLVVSRICDYLGTDAFLELRREWFSLWQLTFPETALRFIDSKAPAVIEALYFAKISEGFPPDVDLLGIESTIRHSDVQNEFLDDAVSCLLKDSFALSSPLTASFSMSSDQLAAVAVASCVESRFCRACIPRPIPFRHDDLNELVRYRMTALLPKTFLSFLSTNTIPGAQLVIAGGCISEALTCKPSLDPASDVDVWIVGERAAERERLTAFCRALQALASPSGEEPLFCVKGSVVTAYASWLARPVQIIRSNFTTMLELVAHFDLTHVQCAWDGKNDVVMTAGCALAHATKKTRITSWMTTKPIMSRIQKASRRGFDTTPVIDTDTDTDNCDSRYITAEELAACTDRKRRRVMIECMTGGVVAEDMKTAIEISFAEDMMDHPAGDNAIFFKAKYETFDVLACRRKTRPFLVCDSPESWMAACSMVQCAKLVETSFGGLAFLRKDAPIVRTPFAIFHLRILANGNGVAVTMYERSDHQNHSQISRLQSLIGSAKDFACSVRFDEALRFETCLCRGAVIEDAMTGNIVPFEMIESISRESKCARVSVDAAALLSIEEINGTVLQVVNHVLSMRIDLSTVGE